MANIEILELLNHDEISTIAKGFHEVAIEKQKNAYNLYTLSSYSTHLENFHSDLIASLVNPKGLHNEGYLFLNLFIKYLNECHDAEINISDFKDAVVTREFGRIDILIRDSSTHKAIIIENKINNAPDMEGQLDRYAEFVVADLKYKISAIIYLTLDGLKIGPVNNLQLLTILKNIGAFKNLQHDLYNGWLVPCTVKCKTEDAKSLLFQYGKLIKHLANKNMDSLIKDNFYDFLNQQNGLSTVQAIVDLTYKIPEYRADKFRKGINGFLPFRKEYRYRSNYWLFENYKEGDNNFKLDIVFEVDGSSWIVFWNPQRQTPEGWAALKQRLVTIGLFDEFDSQITFGLKKIFSISDKLKTISDIDRATTDFVVDLMKKLEDTKLSI